MSSNKALIILVVSIWTVIGGYYLVTDQKDPHEGHDHSRMTAKLSAGVSVSFDMLTEKPAINEPLEVVAEITSLASSGELEYKFFMPKNTELISPDREGLINLNAGEPQLLNIRFSQSVDYDMKIHLEIRKPGSANASMFTFSTLAFKKNQEEVRALQERQSEYGK